MSKRAVILAGGLGTRLRPYTIAIPKPLMPIGEYPILEIIIRQLSRHGFDHITMAVNHQAELIKAFFNDGSKWNLKIDYSLESKPLGTMGPLNLINDLPENFLVMNGDILTDLDYSSFYDSHCKSKNNFTVSSYVREQKNEFGILQTEDNKIISFQEKPTSVFEVSMGIYALNKKVVELIPHNTPYGFDQLMLELIKNKTYPSANKFSGFWLDIGRPDDYVKAIDTFESVKHKFI